MAAVAERSGKAYRLANYYLAQLRLANDTYHRGGESSNFGLRLFEQEWPQIRHWQAWAASRIDADGTPAVKPRETEDSEAAALCSAFPEAGGELLSIRQNPRAMLEWLEVALAASRRLGETSAVTAHLTALSTAHFALSAFKESQDYAEQALVLAQETGEQALYAQNLSRLGQLAEMNGQFQTAQEYYEQSLAINRSEDDKAGIALNLNRLGMVAYLRGDNEAARGYFEQSLAVYRAKGNEAGMASPINNLGLVTATLGDLAAARGYFEQSLVILRKIGNQVGIGRLLNNLGVIAMGQKDYASAGNYLEQSLALERELGHRDGIAYNLGNLGVAAHRQGNYRAARDYLEQCVVLLRSIGNQDLLAEYLAKFTHTLVKMDELAMAARTLHEGLTIVRQMEADPSKEILIGAASMLWLRYDKPEKAALWLGLLFDRWAAGYDAREYLADDVLPDFAAVLGTEKLTELMEQGKSLTLNSIVAEILDELNHLNDL